MPLPERSFIHSISRFPDASRRAPCCTKPFTSQSGSCRLPGLVSSAILASSALNRDSNSLRIYVAPFIARVAAGVPRGLPARRLPSHAVRHNRRCGPGSPPEHPLSTITFRKVDTAALSACCRRTKHCECTPGPSLLISRTMAIPVFNLGTSPGAISLLQSSWRNNLSPLHQLLTNCKSIGKI